MLPRTSKAEENEIVLLNCYSVLQNKLAIAFFENLVKTTGLAIIIPYQSANKSRHDRIRYNYGTIYRRPVGSGLFLVIMAEMQKRFGVLALPCMRRDIDRYSHSPLLK